MLEQIVPILPMVFAMAGITYLWLAVRVSRESTEPGTNAVSYFLFLIGAMVLGAAFTFGSSDPSFYGVGRVLSFFGSGFIPVVLYVTGK